MKRRLQITVISLLLFFSCFAQPSSIIRLRSGDIAMKLVSAASLDSFNHHASRFENNTYCIIRFENLPDAAQRKALHASGITLLEYIPDSAYAATINGGLSIATARQLNIFSIHQLSAEQKMDVYLGKGIVPSWAVKVPGTADVLIKIIPGIKWEGVFSALKDLEFENFTTELIAHGILSLRVPVKKIKQLAALPFVTYVQAKPPQDVPLNSKSRIGSRAHLLNAPVSDGGKGLNGEGVVIGIGDNADVQQHVDFSHRLINRTSITHSVHGVHTTGTMAGAGIINELYRGYASRATIVSQVFSGILNNAASYVQDYGMVLTNNSYGNIVECDYNGNYDLYAQIMDQQAFDLPFLQNVFAAGNSGALTCPPYPQGFHTVLGGYQAAKNILCVGATTDSGMLASFSSRGPVKDGRIKPEIMAMGQSVTSTWPGNTYVSSSGTSMASPAVTGGLALLYQRYRQLNGGKDPKSALIKALACNGAADKGNKGPDFSYGYGWMNLLRSVTMLENNYFKTGSIAGPVTQQYSLAVPANTAELKVMLYWHDPPAALIAAKTLVNDLDLEVTDPLSNTILPQVLDTTASRLNFPATRSADHLNNIEQVVITAPAAGNYNLLVKGTAITTATPQEYFLVYDIIPVSLKLTYPVAGNSLSAGDQVKISWDFYGDTTGTFKLEYSVDNGVTWNTIITGLNAARRIYTWVVPPVTTANALVRITKEPTAQTSTSGPFVIIGVPVISLASLQCETYASLTWTAVASASTYEVMWMQNGEMITAANTSGTSYTFNGLNRDSVYWFSVRALIAGKPGRRAIAVSRKPDAGTCAGNISDNDLRLEAIVAPNSGRKFTSTELGPSTPVTIRIKNLDDAAATNVTVKYAINGGSFISETISTIAAGTSISYTFTTPADFSAVGNYLVTAVVENSIADPVRSNDTLYKPVKHIANPVMDLANPVLENFETALPAVYTRDTLGISGIERFDYQRTIAFGRLRTFVNSGLARSGNKAITMDVDRVTGANINYLIATYNLSSYTTSSSDVRLDFYFLHHGQLANAANTVWIRGNDTEPWIPVYDLFQNQGDPGVYQKSASIEISRLLRAANQEFSSSFQVRWGQHGDMPASDRFAAKGYTIDDVRLYMVSSDLQMLSVNEPISSSCALGSATAVKVTVRNSSENSVVNVPVRYRINGGGWFSEIIPSIAANTTVVYSFNTTFNFSAPASYLIEAVVDHAGDSFRENDTVRITIINAPVINSFPHIQDFEAGNHYWHAGGKNSSWQFGTPASNHIKTAASGTKSWKTRLAGNYNDQELSYLYSPCYDISNLNAATLSFSIALDIEDCGSVLCDAAWVEYSADGVTWNKLGAAAQGVNWYNKATTNLWSIQNYRRWHVATIPLPAGLNNLRLRFVFSSDPGVNREGIAIDDIHIYDNSKGIFKGPPMTSAVSKEVIAGQWIDFESAGKKIASVRSNQPLGMTAVGVYIDTMPRWNNGQYFHPRNITIKPAVRVTSDSVSVRFYFTDHETEKLLKDTGCAGCTLPQSAYDLGVSKYTDPDTSFENGIVTDDLQGVWTFIRKNELRLVPFDIGYYAEFKVKDFSEFWLNHGGPDRASPLPVKLMDFQAKKSGPDAVLTWKTGSESEILRYEIEVAKGEEAFQQGNFIMIGQVNVTGNSSTTRAYSFTDTEPGKSGVRYYRLKIISQDGSSRYSATRPVVFEATTTWKLYPNPSPAYFHLEYMINDREILQASLYDSKGSLVKNYQQTGNGAMQKLQVDLTGMAAGVYLLRVHAQGEETTYRLFKK